MMDHAGRSENNRKTLLALGDSYTIGESVPGTENFPSQTVNLLNAASKSFTQPEIIAVTGWTTGDLIGALDKRTPARNFDLVSLLIGVNNQYQGKPASQYQAEFEILLQKAISYAAGNPAHVYVLSIPDYSVTPFAVTMNRAVIAGEIDLFNSINRQLAKKYGVHYLPITEESRKAANDPSLLAPDGLHYSGKEYSIWANMLTGMIGREMS